MKEGGRKEMYFVHLQLNNIYIKKEKMCIFLPVLLQKRRKGEREEKSSEGERVQRKGKKMEEKDGVKHLP